MWRTAGVLRTEQGLEEGLGEILALKRAATRPVSTGQRDLVKVLELQNMLCPAEMVLRAALHRTESRGAHYRRDYPGEDERWKRSVQIQRQGENMRLSPS
jgi:succinate dehydrogenase/fumarate reductase flavoprotein subunit